MSHLARVFTFFCALVFFAIPIEKRHDKIFRFVSKSLALPELHLPSWFDKRLCFFPTDIAVLFVFLIALYLQRQRIRSLIFTKESMFLWLVFLGSLLSIAASPLAHYPLAYSRLAQLLVPILLFCALASRGSHPQVMHWVLTAIVVAGALQASIALAQYMKQDTLGLRFLGEAKSPTGVLSNPSQKRWIFDSIEASSNRPNILFRSSGTMPHCNALGGFLCIALLASYALFVQDAKKQTKKFLYFSIPCLLMGLFVTFSRSAILGWLLGSIAWVLYAALQKGWRQARKDPQYASLAKLVGFSLCLCLFLFHEPLLARGESSPLSKASNQERFNLQRLSLAMIQEKPLVGWGYHQYALGAARYLNTFEYRPMEVHNIFLLLATETGVITSICFFLFCILILLAAAKAPFTPYSASFFSIFLSILFIGACDLYPLFAQNGRLLLFGIAGLIAANRKAKLRLTPSKIESWKLFDQISPSYDRVNRILSLKMDGLWRKTVARFLPHRPSLSLLDLATGTGDQLFAFLESGADIASATGVDMAADMMAIAKKKGRDKPFASKLNWLLADAEKLPFPSSQFDVVSCSFGIRNFPHPVESLKEMHRTLKPKGRCLILEFSLPPQPFRWPYLVYLRKILPALGGVFSKQPAAYRYLNETIETFPSGDAFSQLLKSAGFTHVSTHSMALGAVTLYIGEKL